MEEIEFPAASLDRGDRGAGRVCDGGLCAADDDDAPTVRGLSAAGIPEGMEEVLMLMGTSSSS